MERTTKIVLITNNFPFGGASANLLRYLTLALANEKNNIEVLIPTGSYYGNKLDCSFERSGVIGTVRYKYLGFLYHPHNYLGKLIDNILGIILSFSFLFLKSFKKDLDIIVVYNPSTVSMISYLTIKLFLKKKLIVVLSEFYEKPEGKTFSIALTKWYNFYISIKYLVRFADKFIVLSSYLKNYVNSRLRSPKDILILPNLVDSKRFEFNNVKDFEIGKITIGYVGTPTKKDGVVDLIRSFRDLNKKYPNTHLLIIGDLTNGKTLITGLKQIAKELGVEGEITFTGLVSYNEIPLLLNSCQILALTRPAGISAEAGFPTKLGEYFACKKPVLITSVGDIPRYFTDKEHVILVEPGNIDSIVFGFETIITNLKLSEKLSQNGYKWMDENLNYLNQSKKISEFIN